MGATEAAGVAPFRAAVVTVSDGVSEGTRIDGSGPEAARILQDAGFEVPTPEVVPDEHDEIVTLLRSLADSGVNLVVTTGGTGFAPRDVTPEATRAVIEKLAPGLDETMRAAGRVNTPLAALSRGCSGSVGSTLIVNLPGSPKAVRESLDAVLPLLPHALRLLAGEQPGHGGS